MELTREVPWPGMKQAELKNLVQLKKEAVSENLFIER